MRLKSWERMAGPCFLPKSMLKDRISELEQRIARLESQVGELEHVITELEDVKAVGLGRGAEQAISILATYVSEVADGFDLREFLRRLRTVRGPRPVRNRVRDAKELFLKRLAARIKEQIRRQGREPPEVGGLGSL